MLQTHSGTVKRSPNGVLYELYRTDGRAMLYIPEIRSWEVNAQRLPGNRHALVDWLPKPGIDPQGA